MCISDTQANAQLRVGPTHFTKAGTVKFHCYQSGETAIEVVAEDGDPQTVATVALIPSGAPHPGPDCVWLKGWSENEGIPNALVAAGIVTLTGKISTNGFVQAQHARLTDKAVEALINSRELPTVDDLSYIQDLIEAEDAADEDRQHLAQESPDRILIRLDNQSRNAQLRLLRGIHSTPAATSDC